MTRQIDVSNAFPNAVLPEHECIFLEPPKGFTDPSRQDIVLQLLRNQYGLCQAPLHWFNHLKGILESKHFRFEQSKEDPCMFLRHDGLILLVYVDDILLFHKSKAMITTFINKL